MPPVDVDAADFRRACDLLEPADAHSTEQERWQSLARQTGLKPDTFRKKYASDAPSPTETKSLEGIVEALKRKLSDESIAQDKSHAIQESIRNLEQLLRRDFADKTRQRVQVVNVGFLRSGSANYVQRIESGFRSGAIDAFSAEFLLNDIAIEITRAMDKEQRQKAIAELIDQLYLESPYVFRTYIVPIGTQAASACCEAHNAELCSGLGSKFFLIYAGVTDPKQVGLLDLPSKHVCGMRYGIDGAERLKFIVETFRDECGRLAFVYDQKVPQDVIVRRQVEDGIKEFPGTHVEFYEIDPERPLELSSHLTDRLIFGYYFLNENLGRLARAYDQTAFIGLNTTDLGRGAVLSTGNDDVAAGHLCARELLVPHVKGTLAFQDKDTIPPPLVFGLNQKACDKHGLAASQKSLAACSVLVV